MKSIRKRHKELTHATPHNLRHTGATLAKQAGMSLEAISEALTHSDTITTKTYVNTSNVVPITAGQVAYEHLTHKQGKNRANFRANSSKNYTKKHPQGKPVSALKR